MKTVMGLVSCSGEWGALSIEEIRALPDDIAFDLINIGYAELHESPTATGKVYRAILSQHTNESDPTVIILENSIGVVVWSRASQGIYNGILAGAFTQDKTVVSVPNADMQGQGFPGIKAFSQNINTATIQYFQSINGGLMDIGTGTQVYVVICVSPP